MTATRIGLHGYAHALSEAISLTNVHGVDDLHDYVGQMIEAIHQHDRATYVRCALAIAEKINRELRWLREPNWFGEGDSRVLHVPQDPYPILLTHLPGTKIEDWQD